MITCPLCSKVCQSPSLLNYHMVSHTKEKPDKCHICSAAFGTKYDLKKHIKSVHDGIKQIKHKNSHCSLCSYKCCSKTMLQSHLRTHSAEQPFSCSMPSCGFKTKHKHYLQQHVRGVHNNERPYECPSDGCNYKAKSSTNLKHHLKTHSDEKPFACQFRGCSYTCKFKNHLAAHTCRAHSDLKPFKCSHCDFRAKHNSNLIGHLLTHKTVKRFQCEAPKCGFATNVKYSLKVHIDRKHSKKDVFCTTPGCNFRCGSINLLKQHLKRHESPMLECPAISCNYSTRIKYSLLSHISRRHEGFQAAAVVARPRKSDIETSGTAGAMEKLQCRYPNCGYETTLPHRYDRHTITHNEEEKRKHVCTFCFSRFTELSRLKDHLKSHTGEKPYRCSLCDHATACSLELRKHARKIHRVHVIPRGKENEVRKCRTCNMHFWSYSELVLHSLTHLEPVVLLEQLKLQIMEN